MCPIYWCESPCWKTHDLHECNRCLYFPVWPHRTVCTQLPEAHFTNPACQLPASFYGLSAMSVALTSKNCQEEKKWCYQPAIPLPTKQWQQMSWVEQWKHIYGLFHIDPLFSSSECILLWNLCVEVLEEWTESTANSKSAGLCRLSFKCALFKSSACTYFIIRICAKDVYSLKTSC